MATSSHPSMASQSASTQVIAHSALKVAQAFSTIVPPAYLVTSLILRRGRGFSVRGLATTSFGGVVAGAGIGGAAAWGRLRDQPIEAIEDRAFRLAHNASQIRTDDYSVMGATLAGLIVPALFLKRAPLPLLVLGGASIGLGLGVDAHLIKSFQEGKQVKPEGMVGELPVVGGNK